MPVSGGPSADIHDAINLNVVDEACSNSPNGSGLRLLLAVHEEDNMRSLYRLSNLFPQQVALTALDA